MPQLIFSLECHIYLIVPLTAPLTYVCYQTSSAPGLALPKLCLWTSVYQSTSTSLTCPAKVSRTHQGDNKAGFIEVDKKKMAWAWASPGKKSTHLSGRGLPGDGVCKPVSSWGFMCVQGWGGVSPSFRAPNSDSSLWLGGTLVQTWSFWKCHGLCSPQFVVSIFTTNWGVNFHCNDGIMSFGVGVHSIFPPFWNHLE